MWRFFQTLVARMSPPGPSVMLDAAGFSVAKEGTALYRVGWGEVREVFALKEDWGGYDRICLGFRTARGECYVHEDMPGYRELVADIERRFSDHDAGWWSKVAFPAFAANRTTSWGKPGHC